MHPIVEMEVLWVIYPGHACDETCFPCYLCPLSAYLPSSRPPSPCRYSRPLNAGDCSSEGNQKWVLEMNTVGTWPLSVASGFVVRMCEGTTLFSCWCRDDVFMWWCIHVTLHMSSFFTNPVFPGGCIGQVQQGGAVPEEKVFCDVGRGCGVLGNGIQGVEGYIKPLKVLEHIPIEG